MKKSMKKMFVLDSPLLGEIKNNLLVGQKFFLSTKGLKLIIKNPPKKYSLKKL